MDNFLVTKLFNTLQNFSSEVDLPLLCFLVKYTLLDI